MVVLKAAPLKQMVFVQFLICLKESNDVFLYLFCIINICNINSCFKYITSSEAVKCLITYQCFLCCCSRLAYWNFIICRFSQWANQLSISVVFTNRQLFAIFHNRQFDSLYLLCFTMGSYI